MITLRSLDLQFFIMARLILFSNPNGRIWQMIRNGVRINKGSRLAYMPSDGANEKVKYRSAWKGWVEENGGEFSVINNSLRGDDAEKEIKRLLDADILVVTGGNTFVLLNHLRESGLDIAIKNFVKEKGKTVLGFSAGAIVMSPTIRMANSWDIDNNDIGMTDFTDLNLISFDIFPHYEEKYENDISDYEKSSGQVVQRLTDDDFVILSTEN